jgi:micrococcal nuclease
MSSYSVEPCTFVYRVSSLAKVVDGDTIDVNIDLGFDVCTKQRVRLLGIDTPESRTSDKEEKVFGLLSKKKLKDWILGVSLVVYSERFGSLKMEYGPM